MPGIHWQQRSTLGSILQQFRHGVEKFLLLRFTKALEIHSHETLFHTRELNVHDRLFARRFSQIELNLIGLDLLFDPLQVQSPFG